MKSAQKPRFICLTSATRVETDGDNRRRISGYGATFRNSPNGNGYIFAPGAFQRSLEMHLSDGTLPAMLWAHDGAVALGKWTEIREDTNGLFVRGEINIETTIGKDVHALLRHGDVSGLSTGGWLNAWEDHSDGSVTIKEMDLFEISLTPIPADRRARVTEMAFGSKRDFENFLRNAGLPKRAALKVASAGFSALNGADLDDDGASQHQLADRIRDLTADLRSFLK